MPISKMELGKSDYQSRLERFRRLKEQLAILQKKSEKTQEEFDKYISGLKGPCKYETGIHDVVSVCNNTLFKCEFRNSDFFKAGVRRRPECRREQITRLKSLL